MRVNFLHWLGAEPCFPWESLLRHFPIRVGVATALSLMPSEIRSKYGADESGGETHCQGILAGQRLMG